MTANAIALMARSLSFDSDFMSPFSVNARRNNIHATGKFYPKKKVIKFHSIKCEKKGGNFLCDRTKNRSMRK